MNNTDTLKNIKSLERRILNLAKKQKITPEDLEDKHHNVFDRQATFLGNGIYSWCGVHSTDTRELFLLGLLIRENQPLKNNYIT